MEEEGSAASSTPDSLHNDRVEAESPDRAQVAREEIAIDDYAGLVRLLVACATDLGDVPPVKERIDKLYDERAWVVGMAAPAR